MEKIKLSSFLGDVFVFVAYCIACLYLSMLIYNVVTLDISGIYALTFFLLFWILAIGRKIIRFKKVYFDKNCIYTNKFGEIRLQEIEEFTDRKIVFSLNGKRQVIYFNYFYPSDNYFTLKKYIRNIKE